MKKAVLTLCCLILSHFVAQAEELPLDYSYCGYRQSEAPIPDVRNVVRVEPVLGDNSRRIQQAIDFVARQKPDRRTGLRGAVLLGEGLFVINEPLRISASGIVLRGTSRTGTVLRKSGRGREAVVYIEGRDDRRITDTLSITDSYLPAGSLRIGAPLHAGDNIIVWRPSTKEWISHLGCDTWGGGSRLGYWAWHPGEIDIRWDRAVLGDGTLNAPLTTAIDSRWGGAQVLRYEWPGRIENCGVENLTLVSDYDADRPKDEDHAWNAVYMAAARDCWVRQVVFHHFAGSAVIIQPSGSRISVEDCKSYAPVSEIGGMRRRTFYTLGTQTLFIRCFSEHGINDFSAGTCAAGPNAFVQCASRESLGHSGSVGPWASGLLFDCVDIDGNDLRFANLGLEKYGAGWNTANSLMWQSTASGIDCFSPDSDAVCMAYGCWAQFQGNGIIEQTNEHVKPWSIYEQQLTERLATTDSANAARRASAICRTLVRETGASSSPTIEEAMQLAKAAWQPRLTMEMWIDSARIPRECRTKADRVWDERLAGNAVPEPSGQQGVTILNGRLTDGSGALLTGGRHNSPWWNGRLRQPAIEKATYALTRYVPSVEGRGATDRIDSVVCEMQSANTLLFAQNYGLWYDRRRDDHERVRRKDGDVWGPFYEQPFARSGEGTAWDGLSRYDLTRLNAWYFDRLRLFAGKGASKGLLLMNQHYFQHNILEAGAHWVDCPWRTANNINHRELPEPVPFTGDKRIFTAEQFYDTQNETLAGLHRQYIRQTLDAFSDNPNVIHSIGEEFTGPLHFVRFWLDVIGEWEREHGQRVLVALTVNKDVQDSILADKARADVVDIIGIEQWFYHAKGLYAPPGGVNMAPRQYQRKIRTGSARFEDVYRSVSEYTRQYPDKAVVYYAQKYPEMGWAVLMAGGSCPDLNLKGSPLATLLPQMRPADSGTEGTYLLEGSGSRLFYKTGGGSLSLALPGNVPAYVYRIDARNGKPTLLSKPKSPFTTDDNGIFLVTAAPL